MLIVEELALFSSKIPVRSCIPNEPYDISRTIERRQQQFFFFFKKKLFCISICIAYIIISFLRSSWGDAIYVAAESDAVGHVGSLVAGAKGEGRFGGEGGPRVNNLGFVPELIIMVAAVYTVAEPGTRDARSHNLYSEIVLYEEK